MKPWPDDTFLLGNPTAVRLFDRARGLPIIDYHCHLDAAALAEDRSFVDLTELWIASDPYKHRAMRIAGVPEGLITGTATPRQKFDAWAATVPKTIGNPLFHWTAMELDRYFDIRTPLDSSTADRVWDAANERLSSPGFTARGLLSRANVRCLCTSDRLLDDLGSHRALARSDFAVRVLPSLRGDDITALEPKWMAQLGADSHDGFTAAVVERLDAFDALGCRLADVALDDFTYVECEEPEAASLFARRLSGKALEAAEEVKLRSWLLGFLGRECARRGWILQLHIGAQRRTSSRLRRCAGAAGGYAAASGPCHIPSLCGLLDDLEKAEALPRVILYPLNPADFAALAILTGSFTGDSVAGKVQLGPAWWYNDHALGIRAHLDAISHYGLLSTFIGMTTDSRSFLSMVRHEYFRRVLCDWLGERVERGDLPDDPGLLGSVVRDVCHDNAESQLNLQAENRHE